MSDPNACAALTCIALLQLVEVCEKTLHCPYAWARRGREDRAERGGEDAGHIEDKLLQINGLRVLPGRLRHGFPATAMIG